MPDNNTEEGKEGFVAPVEKEEAKPTAEELKAKAETLEAQLKEAKVHQEERDLAYNYSRRIEKAQEKLNSIQSQGEPTTTSQSQEDLNVRDLLALAQNNIAENSDFAKILKKYKDGGIIKNYSEGIVHAGIKAEFQSLQERDTAQTVVDESNTDEYLKSKKEVIASYKAGGNVPNDPKLQQAIVDDNLKNMGM